MLVLAAHYLRFGGLLFVLICLGMLILAWVPRTWATRTVQVGLALGALEWLGTAMRLVDERQAMGLPWHRLAAILGSVGGVALVALLLLFASVPRRDPAQT
jgi:hypothetical protein